MSARQSLAAARNAGVIVDLVDQDLELQADREPPPAVLAALKRDKAAIVALLYKASDGWSGEDWLAFFDERAGILEHDGGVPRAEAERAALDHCVARWLATNPPVIPQAYFCIHCGTPTGTTDLALALSDGERNAWVHARCHEPFLRARRAQALDTLAKWGIVASTDSASDFVKFAGAI